MTVPFATPTVKTVNLVSSDNEGGSCFFEDVQRFNGLRLKAFHDVTTRTAMSATEPPRLRKEAKECAWRINEQQPGI